jgi:very-short-patch-repair endonuclease|tara:strand:+ start:9839 stop:10195 length:357 start_codon:yes stop_codon:yes gene_type:complete
MAQAATTTRLLDQIAFEGLPTPEQEYRFAPEVDGKPVRRWRADLAWPDRQLAVEIDGGMFFGGRHGGARSVVKDLEKRNAYALLGWQTLHVTPTQVIRGEAIKLLLVAFGHKSVGEIL